MGVPTEKFLPLAWAFRARWRHDGPTDTSDAGKPTLVASMCRILQRRGLWVGPFKLQNRAPSLEVTADGREIGRSGRMGVGGQLDGDSAVHPDSREKVMAVACPRSVEWNSVRFWQFVASITGRCAVKPRSAGKS